MAFDIVEETDEGSFLSSDPPAWKRTASDRKESIGMDDQTRNVEVRGPHDAGAYMNPMSF
jgi:hypothetical protein